MKLLFCEDCGDIVAPCNVRNSCRYCACGRHAVWLEGDGEDLSEDFANVCDTYWTLSAPDGEAQRAWILHVSPDILAAAREGDSQAGDRIFRQMGAAIVRMRPGDAPSSRWSPALPAGGRAANTPLRPY